MLSRYVQRCHSAAHSIQALVRGFLVRKSTRGWRRKIQKDDALRRYNDAATAIQANFRGVLIRKHLPLLRAANLAQTCLDHGGPLDLQRVCRGFLARRSIVADERHRRVAARLQERAQQAANRFALRHINRHKLTQLRVVARQKSNQRLRHGCAIMIQKTFRGYLARSRYAVKLKKYRASLLMHCVVEAYLVRAFDMATLYHKERARAWRQKEVSAAIRIQALFRMVVTRRRVWSLSIYALRIQKAARAWKARRTLHQQLRESSAVKIQKCYRRHFQQQREKQRFWNQRQRLAMHQERTLAAIIIQAAERRRAGRKRYLEEQRARKIAFLRVQRIARKMVSAFDDKRTRREWRENMLARRVQRRWFAYTTEIKENFEMRRLEAKIALIVLCSMSSLETTARMTVEDEWTNWTRETIAVITAYNNLLRDLMLRVDDWQERGQFCAARMARLRDAQRFARGLMTRKSIRRALEAEHQEALEAGTMMFKFEQEQLRREEAQEEELKASRLLLLPKKKNKRGSSDSSEDEDDEYSRRRKLAAKKAEEAERQSNQRKNRNIDNESEHSWERKQRRRNMASAARRKLSTALQSGNNNDHDSIRNAGVVALISPAAASAAVVQSAILSPTEAAALSSALVVPTSRALLDTARHHVDIYQRDSSNLVVTVRGRFNMSKTKHREQRHLRDLLGDDARLKQQENIDLSGTFMTMSLLRDHFVSLRFGTQVVYLNMSNCSLGDDAAIYVIQACSGLDSLQELDLSSNPFGDTACTHLVALLESRPALADVDISNTLVTRRYHLVVDDLLCRLTTNENGSFSLQGRLMEEEGRMLRAFSGHEL